jgi:succinate dehydrogenase hydrophobic anchor subunit
MLLVAFVGGLLGSLFNHLNGRLTAWRKARVWARGARWKVFDAVAVAALTATVAFTLPLFFSCKARRRGCIGS